MKIQEIYNRLFTPKDELFEMANLRKKDTGLPVNIYVSSGDVISRRHGPRIKVMYDTGDKFNHYKTVSVILKKDITDDDVVGYERLPSSILNPVRDYINLNYDILMGYWNDDISTLELGTLLKKLT